MGISFPILTHYSSLPEKKEQKKNFSLHFKEKETGTLTLKKNPSSEKCPSSFLHEKNILPIDRLFILSEEQKEQWKKICEISMAKNQDTLSDLHAREKIEKILGTEKAIQYYWYLLLYKKKF